MDDSPSTRRMLTLAIAFALAVVLGSCGIPADDRPREIDPTLLEDITDRS